MKKFKKIGYIILLVIIVILSLSIYTNASKNNQEDQKQKGLSEIQFVESKIVNFFNTLNNIEYKNYTISTGDLSKETTEKSSSDSSSQGASKQEASSGGGSTGESGNSSSQGSSSSSGGGGGSSSESSSQQEQGDNKKFDLKQTGVLTNTEDINWDSMKNEVENLYTSLPSITIDLYQLNINQQDVLSFNREYDTLTTQVKDEKKEETLAQLTKLYDYLPKFLKSSEQDEFYTNLIETKANVLKGYSKLDSGNWEEITKDIQNAIQVYGNLLTKTEIEPRKQYGINKVYIMLNELQSAANQKDVSIFLIKYKNLLEEMNNM